MDRDKQWQTARESGSRPPAPPVVGGGGEAREPTPRHTRAGVRKEGRGGCSNPEVAETGELVSREERGKDERLRWAGEERERERERERDGESGGNEKRALVDGSGAGWPALMVRCTLFGCLGRYF
jgi:hypothetical protein